MLKELIFKKIMEKSDERPKKKSLIKDLISDPDSMELYAYVEKGELTIKIRRHKDAVSV